MGDQVVGGVDDAALVTLRWNDGVTVDELARIVRLSQPGAVRLVDRLAEAGMVKRKTSEVDGRIRSVHLTPKGRRRSDQVLAERSKLLTSALAGLDQSTALAFQHGLEQVLEHLTIDEVTAFQICRLCDEDACGAPQNCPVECAVEKFP
jgi:DNA-binding MarR family transcriptional regulator